MELEARTVRRVLLRLVPFLILCYFVAYLDRVNVGFAALTMNAQLGLSSASYGLGAGLFFVAYFFLEVPSNLFLAKFGARKWIARIMFTWGVISGATAFIPQIAAATGLSNEHAFYAMRLLLGAAEAGFFPGVIFYFTLWFPAAYRGRVVGLFMTSQPLGTIIGAPLSGWLLGMDGVGGVAGWQWMFLVEALPALALASAVLAYLTDYPSQAGWLTDEQRRWLADRLRREAYVRLRAGEFTVTQTLRNPRVLLLGFVYFGVVASNYGLGFFLPQIVNGFGGLTKLQVGLVTAVPYVVGLVGMVLWGLHSDRAMERRWHTAIPLLVAGAAIAASTQLPDPTLKMAALSVAGFGIFAVLPAYWALPTAFLTGPAAASGIAIVNSIGNLAGFYGPTVTGWVKQQTGSYTGGLLIVAALALGAALVALVLRHDPTLEAAPDEGTAGMSAAPAE